MLQRGICRRRPERQNRWIVSPQFGLISAQRKWIFSDLLCLETNVCFDNQTEWYSWDSSRLSPEVCFLSLPKLDVCTCRCTWMSSPRSVCAQARVCVCRGIESCQWWWRWTTAVTSRQMIVSTCCLGYRSLSALDFSFSQSVSCFSLWSFSFEIWRRRLLHQRSVDHWLAQEVWHRRHRLPLQETLRRTRVLRGPRSYHRKPGCHGNLSKSDTLGLCD